ncbi:uncharacterized protein EV422DRAFT_98033 [Fimicolochytrium jonesii]|uniref:uncharacterized protein n=1 Tax=Fimicolochytrium jonesii TaxID=1396493 RepID=UPI0022FE52E9|nr:uncharacterized protein EV422DRAFT_98033 [Fimicolochytrium jonesii]KAI8819587.1 hypothetical protein EV422DRAFT_98033 [Fimicolochytrium jonesii]
MLSTTTTRTAGTAFQTEATDPSAPQQTQNCAFTTTANPYGSQNDVAALVTKLEADVQDYRNQDVLGLSERRAAMETSTQHYEAALRVCLFNILKDHPAAYEPNLDFNATIAKLKSLTEECELQFYEHRDDDAAFSTVTICGNIFVIDAEIFLDGKVKMTRLSYATETHMQDEQHELADGMLHGMLTIGNYNAFRETLMTLAFLDKHSAFHQLHCIENDLSDILKLELVQSGNDYRSVMLEGHGLPAMHERQFGISIAYWASPATLLDVDSWPSLPRDDVFRAFVELKPSGQPVPTLASNVTRHLVRDEDEPPATDPRDYSIIQSTSWRNMAPLHFRQPLPTSQDWSNVSYFLRFEPAIPAAVATGDDLAVFADGPGNEGALRETNATGTFLELLMNGGTPEEAELLPYLIGKSLFTTPSPAPLAATTTQYMVFSPSAPSLPGLSIRKVPFTNSSQLHAILKIVRRQLVFNYLVASCFNVHTAGWSIDTEDTGNDVALVNSHTMTATLVEWTPPTQLIFDISIRSANESDPTPPVTLRLTTNIDGDSRIQIRLEGLHHHGVPSPLVWGSGSDQEIEAARERLERYANVTMDMSLVFGTLCEEVGRRGEGGDAVPMDVDG